MRLAINILLWALWWGAAYYAGLPRDGREWALVGATVLISMYGFYVGTQTKDNE